MKAVIPVAGAGAKLRPHTHTQPKPLIPVAGKPILGHIIESLLEAGVKEQVFIIGYLGEKIRDYVQGQFGDRIHAEFVVQEPRKGLAHAIWFARDQIRSSEEILIVLGDTLFGEDIGRILRIEGPTLGVQEVDDPRSFGVAMHDIDEKVTHLIEKPEIPKSNLALVGLYKINQLELLISILDEMLKQPLESQSSYALTDALMQMINHGVRFNTFFIENWYDCGKREGLLHANRILLERTSDKPPNHFDNCVIIPPVLIAPNCHISNSVIGPYVAVSEHAEIRNSIVGNSIIGAYAHLDSIVLKDSVIGNDTSLKGHAHRINIGDNTEIDFRQ